MKKLYWTQEAIQDRETIYDFVEVDSPRAALQLDKLFEEKASRLIAYPELGKAGRVPGTRELVIHQNYILIYDVIENSVRVLRVLHAARQWPSKKIKPYQFHE